MKNKIFIILLIFIFISCTKEIEIDIPVQKQSLVVYSTIVPFTLPYPKFLFINLTATKHIYDTTTRYIDGATIFFYKNEILIDTLFYVDSLKFYPLHIYPNKEDKYSIVVKKEKYDVVTANTVIPNKVIITDTVITPIAYFDDEGGVFSEISVTFTDPEDEINYYELIVSDIAFSYYDTDNYYELSTNDKIITSESYYPSLIRFDVRKPKCLLFTDKEINGLTHTLNVYYTPPQTEDDNRYISDHFITVHLRNVTEDYYKFKTTMIQHLYSKQEDILYGMAEPLNVITNIENGYGLFAGFNNDIVSLHVNKTMISKK